MIVSSCASLRGGAVVLLIGVLVLVPAASSYQEDARAICVNELNFTLKVEMMHGFGPIDGYSRNSGCAYQCGRKTFRWDNGPQGFGDGTPPGTSTQWPSSINMAATFDPGLALEWGTAMGEEFWNKGTNIQEGPGINVARIMRNGRNFEYISGEDPILGKRLVTQVVQGIQENVLAIAKHYINNNQETHRVGVNEVVDEVTLMELYGVPFHAAVEKAAGVMCAYNRINGEWACQNKQTLMKVLKGIYNFSGFVVSDWGATHSTAKAIQNGLDIEMPGSSFFSEDKIRAAIEANTISMENIDESCTRILGSWLKLPDKKRYPCHGKICIKRNVSTPEHKQLARKISSLSTVLLKNEGILPLQLSNIRKVALIGVDATGVYTGGQGSGSVTTNAVVSPIVALGAILGSENVIYDEGKTLESAVSAAKSADVAIVFGSAHAGEGHDRQNLNLGHNTDEIIPGIAAAQPRTIVVMTVPGSILTPWRDDVPAILTNFFPGEQVGPALGDILFGRISPQAKLPVTMPNKENEQEMTQQQYPGVPTSDFDLQANYTEGQIVGYRYYDKHGIKPAFAFGHGLSYGTFTYSELNIEGRKISFKITRDKGSSDTACDTPQIYFSYPGSAISSTIPSKVLRHFEKACDDSKVVAFEFDDLDVSNWDVASQKFIVTRGKYAVSIGSSSQDIRLSGSFDV